MSGASITVEAKAFSKALAGVVSVVPGRSTIPILSNVLIEQKSGTMRLVSTNLDMEVRLPMAPAEFTGEMAITVDAKKLADIFRNLPDGSQAKITLGDNGRLSVTGGRSKFQLPTLPAQDFPQITKPDHLDVIQMPVKSALDIFDRLQVCQSNEEVRYYLNGIFMHAPGKSSDRSLTFAATNGHLMARMVLANVEVPGDVLADYKGVIIGSATVGLLRKLWETVPPDCQLTISYASDKMIWSFGDWQVTAKTVDGDFPDYSRVMPANNDKKITLDGDIVSSAINRALLLSSHRENHIKLSFEKDKLVISMNDVQGTAVEEVPVSYEGDPIDIGFNGKYFNNMVGVVPGGTICLGLADGSAPTHWTPLIEGHDFIGVVMPMRF